MIEEIITKDLTSYPSVEDVNKAIASTGLVGDIVNSEGEWEKDWLNLDGVDQYVFEIALTQPEYTRIIHDEIPEGAELVRVIYDQFTATEDALGAEVRFPERTVKFKGKIRQTWVYENERPLRDISKIKVWILELEEK